MPRFLLFLLLISPVVPIGAMADEIERTANNGNLVMQGIPEIPPAIVDSLNQYQNVRSASFVDWSSDSASLYVRTRFGDVTQIHKVSSPAGTRKQITFFSEPIGQVKRRPASEQLAFTMDAGGSEFSQIFTLDQRTGKATMLTDGESRNGAIRWDREGEQLAFQSTARNGRSNDIWIMEIDTPESKRILLESPDGTWWGPSDFDSSNKRLLIRNYVSIVDSRIHLIDLESGELRLLAGGNPKNADGLRSVNTPIGFDKKDEGFFFLTDRSGEFTQLAWAPLEAPNRVKLITTGISWDVEFMTMNLERTRGAFVVNADGINTVYLLDPETSQYKQVTGLPTGLVGGMAFSPDGTRLAMTLNTPKTPSDTFVLTLGKKPLQTGELIRWTFSEVGGLDTATFIEPELIHYKTFDGRMIPAFLYRPKGRGPFPVVISIHGGPEGQAVPSFSSTYQMWLEKLGVAILLPNVRGSAGYGKSYLQLDNGFKREDSVRDIGALLDWIGREASLDEKRVAVFGGSYGGYMVLASAVHFSDRLKAAVDIVGISNFVTFLENTQAYRRDLRRVEYGDERDPVMREHLQKISPLNNVSKIKIPMLVVQGQNDPRVPVTESAQLVSALREQGQTVWYMNALNEGHGYRKKENRDIYQQATVIFLKQHLLGSL